MNIGDVVTRSDGATYRLVGTHGNAFVGERLDAFEGPARLTGRDLSEHFDATGVAPKPRSESEGWNALAATNRASSRDEWSDLHEALLAQRKHAARMAQLDAQEAQGSHHEG